MRGPPPFPPEEVDLEPLFCALDDEFGATGIVGCPVPLGLDVLGLPPPLPPTPGRADPYWSCDGEVAPAVGASTPANSAITASAIANRGI